ncbi:hypothetical protein [Microbacterium sp. 22242]|uniref:hypothetical protein n=1 Tax=Microbacterium sp. 22242 TaxID=3453896 RepID=UPI003F860C79
MIQILGSLSPQGAGLATKAGALPAGITGGLDALRATVFTAPDAAKALRTLDRGLVAQCGGRLIADPEALIAQVPTKTGDRITHADDTFDACGTASPRELGWTGAVRVVSCGDALISFDYGKGAVSTTPISTSGDADGETPPYPYLTGDHIVWTQTTEKKQAGLTQPLFTGTLFSVDATLSHVQTTVVFADQPAAATPEFMAMAAGGGFAVVGGRASGSQFYTNSATAPSVLYDLRGDKPKKADTVLPPYVDGLGRTPDFDSALAPLWQTTEGKPVYLDLLSGSLTAGYPGDFRYDDGGCQAVSAGEDPAHSGDFSLSDTSTAYYIVAVRGASGLTTGNLSVQESRSMDVQGFGSSGILYSDDGGLTLIGYDGGKKWNIPGTVAKMNARLLGRLLMTNASGQAVVVSEATGKEITDPKDEVAGLMTSIVAETQSTDGDRFSVIQDGDHVIFTGRSDKDGQVALLLDRSSACQNVTVPGATASFDQQYPVTP